MQRGQRSDGRLSEMIITGGENVWPESVESCLRSHGGVAQVAVAGRPDPEWGQRVVAWVVPVDAAAPPALARELYEYVVTKVREKGLVTGTGVFQAHMEVELVNDGPVTLLLES